MDILIWSVLHIPRLSPRVNGFVAGKVADYEEMASHLKLRVDGGDIDFIAAPPLTEDPHWEAEIDGLRLLVETPVIDRLLGRLAALAPVYGNEVARLALTDSALGAVALETLRSFLFKLGGRRSRAAPG